MSDYIDALKGRLPAEPEVWSPVDEALLRQALAEPQPGVYLPAVLPDAPLVVHQPAPLPEQQTGRGLDLMSVRILATGGGIGMAGAGVDLAGHGIAVAGPYLWALAGALAALAGLIALIKGQTSSSSGGTSVTISGGKNRIGRIG